LPCSATSVLRGVLNLYSSLAQLAIEIGSRIKGYSIRWQCDTQENTHLNWRVLTGIKLASCWIELRGHSTFDACMLMFYRVIPTNKKS